MGLLDNFNLNDPMLNFGMGLLSASGPSRIPTSFGQSMVGGMQGMLAAQQRQQLAKEKEQEMLVRKMQIDKAKQEMADSDALRNFDFSQYIQTPQQQALAGGQGPTPEAAAMIPKLQPKLDKAGMLQGMLASPNPALRNQAIAMMQKEQKRHVVGDALVTDDGTELYKAPQKQEKPTTDIQNYNFAVGQGFKGTFSDWDTQRRRASANNVNITQPYEKEFDKQIAGLDAKALDEYRTQAKAAQSMLLTVDRLRKLSPKVYEAGAADVKKGAANFLAGMGLNIDPVKLANSQEFETVASRAVLDSLGGSLGVGVSNADVAFIKNTIPQLGHSIKAREQMLAFMESKARGQIGVWNSAQKYAQTNKGLNGFNPYPVKSDVDDPLGLRN